MRNFDRFSRRPNRGFRDRGNSDRPQMFQAVCDECGDRCEVPFKPTSGKPIFCSNCFEKRGEQAGLRDNRSFDRPQFDRPRFDKPRFDKPASSKKYDKYVDSPGIKDIKKDVEAMKTQITSMNDKITMIMNALKIESVSIKVSKDDAELALQDGSQLVNDMAESQLITSIKNGNMTGIIFWLKNHHKQYSPKLEVTTKDGDAPLTDEQKELIRKSLSMAFNLTVNENQDGKDTITEL